MKKVVLVTGASSGFGKVMAGFLAQKEFSVWGTSRKAGPETSADDINMISMDVQDSDSVEAAVEQVIAEDNRIDVLINNAGISLVSPLEETPLETMQTVMDVNLYGVLRVSRAVIPFMRQQKGGRIINIGSIGGLMGLPYRGVYAASKFALEGLTESLSMEIKPFGISVCMVEPGDFKTNIAQNRLHIDLGRNSPYGRTSARVEKAANLQMEQAASPALMGPAVYRIIRKEKPKLRYRVGSFTEKLSVFLKTILPGRYFEKIIMGYYNLN
jgi:NAD(P)-dependent dehydrogenase (short-subunit alcohol dehydrogenase family)